MTSLPLVLYNNQFIFRLISRQRGGLAALKLTKLFGFDDFPAAKDSGKVLILIIYCYLIIINFLAFWFLLSLKWNEHVFLYRIASLSSTLWISTILDPVISKYLPTSRNW